MAKPLPLLILGILTNLLFVVPSFAQQTRKPNRPASYEDTEGYKVLATILNADADQAKANPISIYAYTVSGKTASDILLHCEERLPVEFRAAVHDLKSQSSGKYRLNRTFSLKKDYRLVATPLIIEEKSTGRFERGVYSFSPVGFDTARKRAIVLVEYLLRPKGSITVGGASLFCLLAKTENGWKIADSIQKCGHIY